MSTFKCTTCNEMVAIPTRKWRLRGRDHLKTMWCWRCKRKTKHRML